MSLGDRIAPRGGGCRGRCGGASDASLSASERLKLALFARRDVLKSSTADAFHDGLRCNTGRNVDNPIPARGWCRSGSRLIAGVLAQAPRYRQWLGGRLSVSAVREVISTFAWENLKCVINTFFMTTALTRIKKPSIANHQVMRPLRFPSNRTPSRFLFMPR